MTEQITTLKLYPHLQVSYNQFRQGEINEKECLNFFSTIFELSKVELKAEEVLQYFKDKESKIIVLDAIKKDKPKKWVSNFDAKNTNEDRKKSLFNQYQRILIKEGKRGISL